METLTLILHQSKATKNKVVYGTEDGSIIQSVYIDKEAVGDPQGLFILLRGRKSPSCRKLR